MEAVTHSRGTVHAIGELCVGGDWACAHGDFAALRDVSLQLAVQTAEPLHCALIELAAACYCDPDRAVQLWNHLKELIHESTASVGQDGGCATSA